MRYRRLSYRYTEVIHPPGPQLGDRWHWRTFELAAPEWRPPADLYETPDEVVLKVELPGVALEELQVTLFEDVLVIQGSRSCPLPHGEGTAIRFLAAEIRYGPFRLEVPVPPSLDRDRVNARYADGFLFVTLDKRARPREAT